MEPHFLTRRAAISRPLVCCAIPLGYGPAAKLIVLAAALRRRGIQCVFVGRGIALELALRERGLFQDVVAASGPAEVSGALLRSSWGILSVMDRDFSPLAAEFHRPLYVVDSLLWMRDRLPECWQAAERIWAQNFMGLDQSPLLAIPAVSVVGPIVDSSQSGGRRLPRQGLVVNLGGCESPQSDGGLADRYAGFVVEGLLASPLSDRFANQIVLLAGHRCSARLQHRFQGCGFEFLSLPHHLALERIAAAELVLTAPGLTATLECFQHGVPACFLPPQNYSQWCILRSLRAAGLAGAALHWEDLSPGPPLGDRLPEPIRNPIVREAIARAIADAAAASALRQALAQISTLDFAELAHRQGRFFDSLGDCGAESIAAELCSRHSAPRARPIAAAAAG